MIKKIAMFALAVSAAFSNAVAADECSVLISDDDLTFTGNQIKPSVTKVVCGDDEYAESDLASVVYGKNINAGTDAGSVTVTLPNDVVVTKNFRIYPKGVRILVDDTEKELGAENPEFTWTIDENSALDELQADTLVQFQKDLKKNIKLVLSDGDEQVGSTFDIIKDPSVNFLELFPNYNIIVKTGKLTITKTKVVVAAVDANKVYGETDPKLEYVITGNIKKADYDKLGEILPSRVDGEKVGSYDIEVSVENMETDDYIVSTSPGKFTISQAPVSLTVDDVSKVYGEATPEFTYKVTGLIGEDVLSGVTLSCAKCSSTGLENVGEYDITASVKAASNPNYAVTTTGGTLTVTPKAAKVTVNKAEKTYGDKDPDFTFDVDGLVSEGEELELPIITRAEGENVGTYKVSVSFAEGSNSNYTLTVTPSTLTIKKKEVTLTVTDVFKKFGEEDPELEYTVEGLATFDGVEDVLKDVALSREPGEDAGLYTITATVDEESNPNYIVTTIDGSFGITANEDKIVVTIKGHTDTVEYNGKERIVQGFDITSNSEVYSLSYVKYTGDSVVSGTDAGKYLMGLSASNFKNTSVNYPNVTFNITDGVLLVKPRSLVVTALADTITYGDATPTEFKWIADSLLEGDELDNIHVSLDKTGLLDAGDYPLTFDAQSPTNGNYVVSSYETNSLTVQQKVVTVEIADAQKVYGDPDPASFLYEVTGLIEGDELPELTLAREAGENVLKDVDGEDSTYRISATFASEPSANYKVKIRQGYFTILPYPNKITVAIFGEDVVMKYTGEEITVDKKFDVALIPSLDCTLSAEYTYSKDFVAYKGEPTVSGTEMNIYPMGLDVADFVNVSPNFQYVSFVLSIDGNLVIDDKGPEISLAAVKGVKTFRLSSMNRRIQVSGSKVGERYSVHDMKGRVVRSGVVDAANFEIPVTNAGVYMVRVGSSAARIRVK